MPMEIIPGPNPVVPTPPAGDSSNRIANTEFVTALSSTIYSAITSAIATATSTSFTDFISGAISNPLNQSYNLIEAVPFAFTVVSFTGKLSTGTMTAYLEVSAVTMTGSTLGASSTQTTVTPTALNTAALGSTLTLSVTSVTSAADFSFVVKFTRPFPS